MCVEIAHEIVVLTNFPCNFVISAHFWSYIIIFLKLLYRIRKLNILSLYSYLFISNKFFPLKYFVSYSYMTFLLFSIYLVHRFPPFYFQTLCTLILSYVSCKEQIAGFCLPSLTMFVFKMQLYFKIFKFSAIIDIFISSILYCVFFFHAFLSFVSLSFLAFFWIGFYFLHSFFSNTLEVILDFYYAIKCSTLFNVLIFSIVCAMVLLWWFWVCIFL